MATSFGSVFGGGGVGGDVIYYRFIRQSGIFNVPFTGTARVLLIGAGGSGGVSQGTGFASTGGGAGEMACALSVPVVAGENYSIVVGTGGAAQRRLAANAGATNGIAGGLSSISGANLTMTALGGGAGLSSGTVPINGGAGGSGGTGGDYRLPGGRGGNLTGTTESATGGGGVNFVNPSSSETTRGGDKSGNVSTSTGGGGTGGRGGDSALVNTPTGGGGYGGNASDATSPTQPSAGGPNALGFAPAVTGSGAIIGVTPSALVPGLAMWGLDAFGGGSSGSTTSVATGSVPGGGGGAYSQTTSINLGSLPTVFGGGGGQRNPGNVLVVAQPAGAGGGGGGAWSGGDVTSGQGGDGLCIIIISRN